MKNLVTIKLNKEYKRAYFQGKFKAHPVLVTYMVPNRGKGNKIGITTSKKIGSAVVRNRARRVIRAAYLSVRERVVFPKGYDIVFVARSDTALMKSNKLEKIMEKQILFLLQNQSSQGKKKSRKGKKKSRKEKEC